jgi:4'-phosphopantetheinyl transferase
MGTFEGSSDAAGDRALRRLRRSAGTRRTTRAAVTGDVVQVWLIQTDLPGPVLAGLEPLLDDAERSRAAAMLRGEHRRRFIAAHGIVRVIVGRHLGTPPAGLRWRHGPHGKPELALPRTSLQVSLSHSGELTALALSSGRRVGVDIQRLAADVDVTRMSERFYPAAEARFVAAAAGSADQVSRFTRLWARKEACVKVTGGRLLPGLKLPVRGNGMIAGDPGGPLPGPYLIRDVRVPRGFCAAVAIEGAEPFRVRTYAWPGSHGKRLPAG